MNSKQYNEQLEEFTNDMMGRFTFTGAELLYMIYQAKIETLKDLEQDMDAIDETNRILQKIIGKETKNDS